MAKAVIFEADAHVASTYGLWPPDADCDGEGGRQKLNFLQEYIYECWQHATTIWLPQVVGNTPKILVTVGDMVDGVQPKSPLVTDDGALQVEAAESVLLPVAKMCEATYSVSGTLYHAGKSAGWDNVLAKRIGAIPEVVKKESEAAGAPDGVEEKDESGEVRRRRYARWQLFLSVEGVLFDIAHTIGGSGVPVSRFSPLMREYVQDAVSAYEDPEWPHPDWIVRAHGHMYRLLPQEASTVLALPGWQAKTPYAHKVNRGRPFDIGMVVLMVDDGVVTPKVKLYKWPKPLIAVVGDKTWSSEKTNQVPSSVTKITKTGQPFSVVTGLWGLLTAGLHDKN
jgi:hypothetical protein